MLGYTLDDLNNMINATHLASVSLRKTDRFPAQMLESLQQANDFLQGLWAEGYFE